MDGLADAGVVDIEVALPGGRITVQEMSRACGVPSRDILEVTQSECFPVLGEDEQSWRLAATAAEALLERTGVPADRIGQVIFAGSAEWDVPFWSPAAKVAGALGIHQAHCFEVANFCNAGSTALRTAVDAISAGRCTYALVLVADRLSRLVDHHDPESKALFNFGDAAAAVLVGPHGRLVLRHAAMRTDPTWSDYYAGCRTEGRVVIRREGHRSGLAEAYVDNFQTLVKQTLVALEADITDVSYFLINHGDRSMHERLLQALGLPRARSVFNYGPLAHMGSADTLIALRDVAGRLVRGDLVLLATSAVGFTWGITALECVS